MKRLIFALLYRDGYYVMSRNFRLQRVGDLEWVLRNYAIRAVSLGIDELMILDLSVSQDGRDTFREQVRTLAEECFVPVTVGGQIRSVEEVVRLLSVGADKVLLNTPFHSNPQLCTAIASRFGSQALVCGLDVRTVPVLDRNDQIRRFVDPEDIESHVQAALDIGAGEILLQSFNRDGTGNGLDLALASSLPSIQAPLIFMGGVGHADHIVEGLLTPGIDAVATANLFNFVADALVQARRRCLQSGIVIPVWSSDEMASMEKCLIRGQVGRGE